MVGERRGVFILNYFCSTFTGGKKMRIKIFTIVVTSLMVGLTASWVFGQAQEVRLGALQDTTGRHF